MTPSVSSNPPDRAVLSWLRPLARQALRLEPVVLLVIGLAFWYPSPARDRWLWLLILIPLLWAARYVVLGRLWTRSALDGWFAGFLLLGVANVMFAPYTRGLLMLGRPLLGMAISLTFIEHVRRSGHLRGPLLATLMLGGLVALLALTGSQWNTKSAQLRFLIDPLPRFVGFPAAEGGFNANEIAGALSWLTPALAGLTAAWWRAPEGRFWRWPALLAFGLSFAALFLGQSRLGIAGTLTALAIVVPIILRARRARLIAWSLLLCAALLEVMLVLSVFRPESRPQQAGRDEVSLTVRFDIWASGLAIIRDYPLTGAGMGMFRDQRVRDRYPVAAYSASILPHAHNELVQAGADLGLPGLAIFCGLYAAAFHAIRGTLRTGSPYIRAIAAGVGAGLLAHGIYGLGDAVTLWDRFAFIFWWLLGLAVACRQLSAFEHQPESDSPQL